MRISDWSSDVCSSDLVSLGSAIGEIVDGALTNAGKRSQPGQTVAPNRLPTPAVNAIARAPQKVKRMIDRMTGAPPAFAPREPRRRRHRSEKNGRAHGRRSLTNTNNVCSCYLENEKK